MQFHQLSFATDKDNSIHCLLLFTISRGESRSTNISSSPFAVIQLPNGRPLSRTHHRSRRSSENSPSESCRRGTNPFTQRLFPSRSRICDSIHLIALVRTLRHLRSTPKGTAPPSFVIPYRDVSVMVPTFPPSLVRLSFAVVPSL